MDHILITGGKGLIGTRLSQLLSEKGYIVKHLSRNPKANSQYETFKWNPEENYIDPEAVEKIDYIIHLAGEPVASGRWTQKKKQRIYTSRINGLNILLNELKRPLKALISASGISYYGTETTPSVHTESEPPGSDFLASISVDWEAAAQRFSTQAKRVVMLRTGVVFADGTGALKKLTQPIQMGVGSPLGSGKQYVPWIHLNDICGMYIKALENEQMNGAYNAVASEHITNAELTKRIALKLNKKIWMPSVPSFALRLLFGEMADIILKGSRISNTKIKNAGYQFEFDQLDKALTNLFANNE